MTNITFDDNLITGNDTIDAQHEELIHRIQQFVTACESGDSKIKAIKMLDYLDIRISIFRKKNSCKEKSPILNLPDIRKSTKNLKNLSGNYMIS